MRRSWARPCWTVALFFRPDITRIELRVEREQVKRVREVVTASPAIVPSSDWNMR